MRHQVAPSAVANYRSVAAHHIVPAIGRVKVAKLTPAQIDRQMSEKLDAGLSVSTVRHIRAVLAQALDQEVRWGSVPRNVASLNRGPKQTHTEGRTLTPEQARSLLGSLRGHRNEALYALMLSTGLRRGEALGLRWADVDVEAGTMAVSRQLKREGGRLVTADTKTARSRRSVNLPEPMVAGIGRPRRQAEQRLAFGDAWVNSGFVFTTSVGTPIDRRNLYREFQQVCRNAGLGDWHPHELRHSAAGLMLAQGVKLQVVSEVLGHPSVRMTADVYGTSSLPTGRPPSTPRGRRSGGERVGGGDRDVGPVACRRSVDRLPCAGRRHGPWVGTPPACSSARAVTYSSTPARRTRRLRPILTLRRSPDITSS